MRLEVG